MEKEQIFHPISFLLVEAISIPFEVQVAQVIYTLTIFVILQAPCDSMNILLAYIDNDNDQVVGIMVHLPKYKMFVCTWIDNEAYIYLCD